jgi:uncharacterized protein
MKSQASLRIGVISDTHGLLRPEAMAFLRGADRILHAGDIGKPEILTQLAALAPVTAVRGNNDQGSWAQALAEVERITAGGVCIHLLHDLSQLALDPLAQGVSAVVTGHSHKPFIQIRDGILYLNPGSAGPRRFKLPITVADIRVANGRASARIVELQLSA